ncbi:hypothetical protein [Nostocoides vanveenii]|jgi:hypothetical protein|uniref:Uncharacterized protein n=1 Tax=Nostocoides vanveenii TaxID=330835 RepID=A0ABN2L3G4_9MICO
MAYTGYHVAIRFTLIRPRGFPRPSLTIDTTTGDDRTYDDSALTARYAAAFAPDGSIDIVIDVFEGPRLVASLPVARYGPDEATGFSQD